MWQLCMAIWNVACLSYHCHCCWHSPPATSLCLTSINIQHWWMPKGVNFPALRNSVTHLFHTHVHVIFQTSFLMFICHMTTKWNIGQHNKIGGIIFRAVLMCAPKADHELSGFWLCAWFIFSGRTREAGWWQHYLCTVLKFRVSGTFVKEGICEKGCCWIAVETLHITT